MPRSYQEIIDQAEQLSQKFETDFEPAEDPEVAALQAAAFRRAQAEADLLKAVERAVKAGTPWKKIGAAVGTSGEAARQRYRNLAHLRSTQRRGGSSGHPNPARKKSA